MDPQQFDDLKQAAQRGSGDPQAALAERLSPLMPEELDYLARFAILAQRTNFEGLAAFFEMCNAPFSAGELQTWLVKCLELDLLQMDMVENSLPYFMCPAQVCQHFLTNSSPDRLSFVHRSADRFFELQLTQLAVELQVKLPGNVSERRAALLGPEGLLYDLAHLPQYQEFHQGMVNFALNWHEHLFVLRQFSEAANLLNAVCFAVARRGQRRMAEKLLERMALASSGLVSSVAWINLATLLREESQLSAALKIYYREIPKLIRLRAFLQLAVVVSEIGAIYRHQGRYLLSAVTLELGEILHGWLKNHQSRAIAQSQLASTYQYLRMYRAASRAARSAISYFRENGDLLNLGRSLLTQGNIYYRLKQAGTADDCFAEALQIGRQISDSQAICGALGGKARVLMLQQQFDEARVLLEETIALRQRGADHLVGVEYQNMGLLYELRGNLGMAAAWYRKALEQFKRYMPAEVDACQHKIDGIEKKLDRRKS